MPDSEKLDLILSKLNKLDKLENDVTDIKLTLENEIRTNIKRVAEGHLDLLRNLHEATGIQTTFFPLFLCLYFNRNAGKKRIRGFCAMVKMTVDKY